MKEHLPDYINVARRYIANSFENGFVRMRAYGWLDQYVKGEMSRQTLVKLLIGHKVHNFKICSILTELDLEKENALE